MGPFAPPIPATYVITSNIDVEHFGVGQHMKEKSGLDLFVGAPPPKLSLAKPRSSVSGKKCAGSASYLLRIIGNGVYI